LLFRTSKTLDTEIKFPLRLRKRNVYLCREGQTRSYSNADRTRLRLILRGKRLGLTLEESAEIINMYDAGTSNKKQLQTLLEKIREKKTQLLEQQKELKLMLTDLSDAEQRCLNSLS